MFNVMYTQIVTRNRNFRKKHGNILHKYLTDERNLWNNFIARVIAIAINISSKSVQM